MNSLPTMRGPLDFESLPRELQGVLIYYDRLRADHGPEAAALSIQNRRANLQRLNRGLGRLTARGIHRIADRLDINYIRDHFRTLTTLQGLFWWNDGRGFTCAAILRLAWRKGARA
jgi:uncharacterized protein (DUF934 family)